MSLVMSNIVILRSIVDHLDTEVQTLKTLMFLEGVKTGLSKKTRSQETI